MDQSSWPGNIGDSCAETSRYAHLKLLLGLPIDDVDLYAFISNSGFLRHPLAPAAGEIDGKNESWRETDFTSDQGLPLFLAARKSDQSLARLIISRIHQDSYKTGNGDLVNPGFYALLTDTEWLLHVSTDVQALLLRFPYRWSDSKNRFEENEESAADYLNWIHCAVYLSPCERKLIPKDLLKAKVRKYYQPEPNCQFLLDLYDQVIDQYF
jgi:hypothetical protein